MSTRRTVAVVLAAGSGTRMKSSLPKVMHPIANRPMVGHLADRLAECGVARGIFVLSPGMEEVAAFLAPAETVIQSPALGTGHAVLAARDALAGFDGDVLVLYGDTPLLSADTLRAMQDARRTPGDPAVAVLGFRPDDAAEYGRLVTDADGTPRAIAEYRDADAATRSIGLCNAGVMAIDGARLFALLDAIGNDNAKGEYYLTDIVAIAREKGWSRAVVEAADPVEVMGVNSRADLARAEAAMQDRLRARAMENGATLIDPGSVWFSHDTRLGRDVLVGPHVVFGPGVAIADNVEICSFTHLVGATIAEGARIGPFARLRPGADIRRDVHIGNFVEIKQALIEDGAKANHLSYIGDTRVGPAANIGAGTITCNYDGFFKERTDIGAGAFIGSNTALVAPVKIGDGAIIGAGTVVTREVARDALAIGRAEQTERAGWGVKFRARRQAEKDAARGKSKKAG